MEDGTVGIDGVAVWPGKLRLDLTETFAPAVGEDPGKFEKGLGLQAISLPDVHEDAVTMGANAALRLLRRKGVPAEAIGRIDVATESAFDGSKPLSTYVAGCLSRVMDGDFRHADLGERKFACISGTQCLDDAHNWIRAGRHGGRAALVIATDTAFYARQDPGEGTQGAGAVAMLVAEDPDLVALEPGRGIGSSDAVDFLKPDGQYPRVDGRHSVTVYLDRMHDAFRDLRSRDGAGERVSPRFLPFHTPFPGMVRKAARQAYLQLAAGTDAGAAVRDRLGPPPRREEHADASGYREALREYAAGLEESATYRSWYARVVEPTTDVASRVGNWYTASVHLARISALHHAAADGDGAGADPAELAGEPLLVASYGSGAQAEVHRERVVPGWSEEIRSVEIESLLSGRRDLDFGEYEAVHAAHDDEKETDTEALTGPADEFVRAGTGDMGQRLYDYVPAG